MEAPLLRWLYVRRRPNQSITVAFDQEVQRLYDEWDALSRRIGRTGADVPAGEVAGYARSVGTATRALESTPHPLPYRTLASVADVTTGDPEQMLRILRDLDPADPVRSLEEVRPRLDRAATLGDHLPARRPAHPRARRARRRAPRLARRRAAGGPAAARRRPRLALVARGPDVARLRRPEDARGAARRTPSRRRNSRPPSGPSSRCSTGCSSAGTPGRGCRRCCSPSAPTGSAGY